MDTHRAWVHIWFIYKGRKGAWRPASVDNSTQMAALEAHHRAGRIGIEGDRGVMVVRGQAEAPSAKAGLWDEWWQGARRAAGGPLRLP